MAISKRRGVVGRSTRRSRTSDRTRREEPSKGRNLSAASFPGKGPIRSTRRKIARAAGKVNPKLNRELA